tara:strand:+ start:1114 stop:1434 length:321 start_codon:yes stop_codon:yes gene_type:complete
MFGGQLRRLWTGALPLEQAFWSYAVLGGIAVNAVTSLGSLILFASDQAVAALVVGYGLSLPYNLAAIVGVWRSAARRAPDQSESERRRADIYRAVTLVGLILLSVT